MVAETWSSFGTPSHLVVSTAPRVSPAVQNFFGLIIIFVLIFWFYRLLKHFFLLSALRYGIQQNQLLPLGFGGIDLVTSNSNIRNQVMLAVRNARLRIPPIDMLRVYSLAHIRKGSFSLFSERIASTECFSVEFSFICSKECEIELYWGVNPVVLEKYRHILSRERKRRVDFEADASGGSKEGSCIEMDVMSGNPSLQGISLPFPPEEFFRSSEREHMSPPRRYSPFGEHIFRGPPEGMADFRSIRRWVRNGLIPLMIVVRSLEPRDPSVFRQIPGSQNQNLCELSSVELYVVSLVPLEEKSSTSSPTLPLQAELSQHIVMTPHGAYDVFEIYGYGVDPDEPPPNNADDEHVCTICMSVEPTVTLLPCRHCCACQDCFPHLDSCPMCRSEIRDHITVRAPSEPCVLGQNLSSTSPNEASSSHSPSEVHDHGDHRLTNINV